MEDRNFGTYKELAVWQKAVQLVKMVYALIKQFPPEERFALADQVRRAVISIPSNIAEGNGRSSNRDYAHFLSIARGSLYETMTQLEIAESLGYISIPQETTSCAIEVRKMLGSMIKKYSPESGQRLKVKGQTEEFNHHCLTSDLGPLTSKNYL